MFVSTFKAPATWRSVMVLPEVGKKEVRALTLTQTARNYLVACLCVEPATKNIHGYVALAVADQGRHKCDAWRTGLYFGRINLSQP